MRAPKEEARPCGAYADIAYGATAYGAAGAPREFATNAKDGRAEAGAEAGDPTATDEIGPEKRGPADRVSSESDVAAMVASDVPPLGRSERKRGSTVVGDAEVADGATRVGSGPDIEAAAEA